MPRHGFEQNAHLALKLRVVVISGRESQSAHQRILEDSTEVSVYKKKMALNAYKDFELFICPVGGRLDLEIHDPDRHSVKYM